jgi:hypothetical protein
MSLDDFELEIQDLPSTKRIVKSFSTSQKTILAWIQQLHCPRGFECDLTYGNGGFWKTTTRPFHCFDLEPTQKFVRAADSRSIPLEEDTLNSVVFDPPFITYVRSGSRSIMAKRFSGYWSYEELTEHYKETLRDVCRVLKEKGVLIFKCQDIVHNHRLHCTHANVISWACEFSFILKDMFLLIAHNRMPTKASANGKQCQKHSRIHHSYFLVFEKRAKAHNQNKGGHRANSIKEI